MVRKKERHNQQPEVLIETENELFEQLITDYTTAKKENMIMQIRRGKITKDIFMRDVKQHIHNYYRCEDEVEKRVIDTFEQYVFGYSILTPLIDNPDISDIRCVSFDNIRIKEKGVRRQADISFASEHAYMSFIDMIATKNQVNISNMNAIQRFVDTRTSEKFILRFTVSMPLVNTYDQPYLHIRKTAKDFPEIPDLIKENMMNQQVAELIVERFKKGSTIICGGNSSGKTTLLNALKETLPEGLSVMVTQQADELTTKGQSEMMFLHSLPGTGESNVSYDLEAISIAALTMDVDFFIIGEVKGGEALYLLNAAYTGQQCAATIHAPSADKALDKVVDYALSTSGKYTKREIMKMLADSFDTVVFMDGYTVDQVFSVTGWDEVHEAITYLPIVDKGDLL